MPPVLNPNNGGQASSRNMSLRSVDLGYDYGERSLRPGTELHDSIVDKVLQRAGDSWREVGYRRGPMRDMDRVLKAYVYQSTGRRTDDSRVRRPAERIIMPASYVVLETLLTYMTSAFFQDPVFKYEGAGPEDTPGDMLLTEVVQKHVTRNAVKLALHTAFRDAFAYGTGYASPRWIVERGQKIIRQPMGMVDTLLNRVLRREPDERARSAYSILFEGNRLDNIDPYRAMPDPNVAAHEVQKGEFFGWSDQEGLMALLAEEDMMPTQVMNTRYLRVIKEQHGDLSSIYTRINERDGSKAQAVIPTNNPVGLIWMYVDLIPKEWGLGRSELPEVWVFQVAGDRILRMAAPVGLVHGKIPVACAAPDFDGYSVSPGSRLFAIEELQRLVDYLYTSHIENIARVINNEIVYDPSLINVNDLNDNKPGRMIRLRKRAWGLGGIKDNAIFQLDVKDATQGNVSEAMFLMEQIKQTTSTMDPAQGNMMPRTSRVSASEFQGLRTSGLTRLERPAQIISLQFMQPIAYMFASNVQQFMSQDLFVKVVGEMATALERDFGRPLKRNRLAVSPLDLVIDYDVTAHDGAMPGKEDGQMWLEMFQVLAQTPELAAGFNMQTIFKHWARQQGARNIDAFVRQAPQVMPDEQVDAQIQQGNLVPALGGDGFGAI